MLKEWTTVLEPLPPSDSRSTERMLNLRLAVIRGLLTGTLTVFVDEITDWIQPELLDVLSDARRHIQTQPHRNAMSARTPH